MALTLPEKIHGRTIRKKCEALCIAATDLVLTSGGNSQIGLSIPAASGARGRSDGTDVTQTSTTIKAGHTASLTSGGDTNPSP